MHMWNIYLSELRSVNGNEFDIWNVQNFPEAAYILQEIIINIWLSSHKSSISCYATLVVERPWKSFRYVSIKLGQFKNIFSLIKLQLMRVNLRANI